MPVIVKRLLRSFQYLFSHKSIIYAILSSAMLRENYSVFLGGKYRFLRGGGINIGFRPKYRPLPPLQQGFRLQERLIGDFLLSPGKVIPGLRGRHLHAAQKTIIAPK
jgi:hypothetical protein